MLRDGWKLNLENKRSKHITFSELFLKFPDLFDFLSEFVTKLLEIQEKAKLEKKGRWSDDEPKLHVRNICWNVDDPRTLVEKYKQKEIDAVVEQVFFIFLLFGIIYFKVRDGSTVRAFLLPNFEYVTVMLSGVKVNISVYYNFTCMIF